MKRLIFANTDEYAGKRKQTRCERLLLEVEQVVPWSGVIALIELRHPKDEGSRLAYPLRYAERAPDAEAILSSTKPPNCGSLPT